MPGFALVRLATVRFQSYESCSAQCKRVSYTSYLYVWQAVCCPRFDFLHCYRVPSRRALFFNELIGQGTFVLKLSAVRCKSSDSGLLHRWPRPAPPKSWLAFPPPTLLREDSSLSFVLIARPCATVAPTCWTMTSVNSCQVIDIVLVSKTLSIAPVDEGRLSPLH